VNSQMENGDLLNFWELIGTALYRDELTFNFADLAEAACRLP